MLAELPYSDPPMNQETSDLHDRLVAAKAAYLREASDDTLYDILLALAASDIVVPVIVSEDGERIDPIPMFTENRDPIFVCFTDMEEAAYESLPENAVLAEIHFRVFLEMVVELNMGFLIDPFTEQLNIFAKPDVCRDIHALLFPPPEQHDIEEVVALKQESRRTPTREATMAFLAALYHAEVYVPGINIYSEADEQRFREMELTPNTVFTTQDPSRFRMNTVEVEGKEYVTVYLHQGDIPVPQGQSLDEIPPIEKADTIVHRMIRRFPMAELAEQHSQGKRIAGLVLDYECPTGAVLLPADLLQLMTGIPDMNRVYKEQRDEEIDTNGEARDFS